MQLKRRKQAGDTLVEVLLAFSIFGLAATTIIRTMNDGFTRMFSSGQQSQIQSVMRGQIAIIQKAHADEVQDPASDTWDTVVSAISPANDTTSPALAADQRDDVVNADGCTYSKNKNRIYFTTDSGATWTTPSLKTGSTAGDVAVAPSGETPVPDGVSIWVEAKQTKHGDVGSNGKPNNGRGYYDFYAKACWSDGRVNRQIKTVTRLYELVAAPGEGSPVTPPTPPADEVVNPISIAGNAYIAGKCVTISDLERTEAMGAPAYALYSSPAPSGTYPCKTTGDGGVVSCSNYDVGYASQVTAPGKYLLTLQYKDIACSTSATQTLSAGGAYYYRVQVYINNNVVGNMVLNPDTSSGTLVIDSIPPGAEIGFRWWNNHWFSPADPSGKDPDFTILRVKLDKQ